MLLLLAVCANNLVDTSLPYKHMAMLGSIISSKHLWEGDT